MTQEEFEALAADLSQLAPIIPLRWGRVQNNQSDDVIPDGVFFNIFSLDQLETIMEQRNISENGRQYLRRRWFITRCADCDEYLFYSNPNVVRNPNQYDKAWDIEFYGSADLRFDVKGTLFPAGYLREIREEAVTRNLLNQTATHPQALADWMYDNQSTGRRYDIQNRLFLMHHSFVSERAGLILRTRWEEKKNLYDSYVDWIGKTPSFINSHNVKADFIWLVEREDNTLAPYYLEVK